MPKIDHPLLKTVFDALLLSGDVDKATSRGIRQFFASGITTLTDITIFQTLLWTQLAGILQAAAVGFIAGIIMNYTLGSVYVFRHLTGQKVWDIRRFIVFVICALISLGLTQLIIYILAIRIGILPLAAKLVAVVTLFFWNMWMSRRVIFNPNTYKTRRDDA